uniref:Uncharacterized protein n=1 Tax=Solanum lycopersicum TaxID=4081 RepID=A0A3Q7HU45_SOLLC
MQFKEPENLVSLPASDPALGWIISGPVIPRRRLRSSSDLPVISTPNSSTHSQVNIPFWSPTIKDCDATLLVIDIVYRVYLFSIRVRRGDETIALAEDVLELIYVIMMGEMAVGNGRGNENEKQRGKSGEPFSLLTVNCWSTVLSRDIGRASVSPQSALLYPKENIYKIFLERIR